MPTIGELLLFHTNDCGLYERLINNDHCCRYFAKMAIALWMWLESNEEFYSLIQVILYGSRTTLREFLAEASIILQMIELDGQPPGYRLIPLTSACGPLGDNILKHYYDTRDRVLRGVARTMIETGRVVFDDSLRQLAFTDPDSTALSRTFDRGDYQPGPVESRSIIIVSLVRKYLTGAAIHHHFTERWGDDCIEELVVEKKTTRTLGAPVRVKVLFKAAAYIDLAFGQNTVAYFLICGKNYQGFRALNGKYNTF